MEVIVVNKIEYPFEIIFATISIVHQIRKKKKMYVVVESLEW